MKRKLALAGLFVVLWGVLAFGIHIVTQNNTLGSDFFIFWNAGRAALFERANPYSDELALQAQLSIFKRPAAAGEDQLGFAYPPYALIVIQPLLWLPFDWAQAVWISFLILSLALAGVAALPHARRWVLLTFLLFYPTFFGMILGNYAILISATLLLFFGIFLQKENPSRGMQVGFGVLAGWLTIKPQFLWLYLIFFVVFALRYHLRWFLASTGFSLVLFLLFSFALMPEWLGWWLESLVKYSQYNQTYLVLTYLVNGVISFNAAQWVAIGLAGLCLIATVIFIIRWWRGKMALSVLLAWLGFCAYLLHPRGKSYEHLVYLLPLLFWAGQHTNWRTLGLNLFWWGSLVASWLAFALAGLPGALASTTELPVLFHAVWVGWMLIFENRSHRKTLIVN